MTSIEMIAVAAVLAVGACLWALCSLVNSILEEFK